MRIFRSTFLLTADFAFHSDAGLRRRQVRREGLRRRKIRRGYNRLCCQMGGQAGCYRSADSLTKVIAFYSKLPGVTVIHTGDKGAMFKLNGVTITLQSPWMNQKTGVRNTDTLISIVKN